MKKLNVKSKKTKVSIDPNLTSITRTQFDMGTYAKKKSGNYTWAKPYFKLVCNDDGNYKKQISYLVRNTITIISATTSARSKMMLPFMSKCLGTHIPTARTIH